MKKYFLSSWQKQALFITKVRERYYKLIDILKKSSEIDWQAILLFRDAKLFLWIIRYIMWRRLGDFRSFWQKRKYKLLRALNWISLESTFSMTFQIKLHTQVFTLNLRRFNKKVDILWILRRKDAVESTSYLWKTIYILNMNLSIYRISTRHKMYVDISFSSICVLMKWMNE